MDYRKFYKERYGIDFGSEYHIHHIDFNRENNDIKNLILLPKDLHERIHSIYLNLGCINTDGLFKFKSCAHQLSCSILSTLLWDAAKIYDELKYWASCKEFEEMRLKSPESPMFYSYSQFR